MPVISLAGFAGENRALEPTLLPPAVGVLSRNHKPGRGDLRPWKSPSTVASVPAGRKTIYRMGRDVNSDANYWLSWPTVVHAVRGFDSGDTTERTFYTGDGTPKVTDNTIALASTPYPTAYRPMGLLPPATAPVIGAITPPSGGGTNETRFYVYTYVNDWGWESAPSPVSTMVTAQAGSTIQLTSFAAPTSGNYHVTLIRVYKTQSGMTGSSAFYFVGEMAVGSSTFTDAATSIGEVLPTTDWLPPPDDLSYLKPLWNGMMAGISGGAVRFCEAYTPYAWPVAYEAMPPDSTAVAMGVFGQSLLVLTTGRPMLVSGSSPDSMDQQPLEIPQACVAPQSVVSMSNGVVWASEDGLCWFGSDGAKILTAGLMLREDWQALVPSSIIGSWYEGLYFGSYSTDGGATRLGFMIDPNNPSGIYFLDTGYAAMHFDGLKDHLYVLSGTSVQKWDAGSLMTVKFRSKVFYQPKPVNFSCAQVVASSYPTTLRVYADGALKHTQTVTEQAPFRLPSGFLSQLWQVEVEGTVPVQGVVLATSIQEISSV